MLLGKPTQIDCNFDPAVALVSLTCVFAGHGVWF